MMRGAGVTFASAFIVSINYFLRLEIQYVIESERKLLQVEEQIQEEQTYDFIIVGAGTSGCILAYRLSEHYRVLLLEAGPSPPSLTSIPALYYSIDNLDAPINSIYSSVPQMASFNRILNCSVGNMMGGSYSHNAMIFNRGSRYDYDNWAQILKDKSFTYKNMLKYFKKLEIYKGEFPGLNHGTNGFIPVETDSQPIGDIWYEAGRELGYPRGDPSGIPANIFSPVEMSRHRGRRCTTYTEYIEPILKSRKNLKVIRLAVVDKVEFTGKRATGVIFIRQGKTFWVKATHEIILTAGTFGTAIILFKSGIGPKKMLKRAKIPVVEDLPVGENFEDHPVVSFPFTHGNSSLSRDLTKLTVEDVQKYLKGEREFVLSHTKEGPQAFIASSLANTFKHKIWPDMQILLSGAVLVVVNGRPLHDRHTIGKVKLNVDLYRQGERKATKLASIDYKIFQNERVNTVLKEGLKLGHRILKTKAFKSIGAELIPDRTCARNNIAYSDDYWTCYIKNNLDIDRHPVGTCAMAHSKKTGTGVVSPKFRVFGVTGLRVADASVIPKIPNANINVAVGAMAEMAAEVILSQYSY